MAILFDFAGTEIGVICWLLFLRWSTIYKLAARFCFLEPSLGFFACYGVNNVLGVLCRYYQALGNVVVVGALYSFWLLPFSFYRDRKSPRTNYLELKI